jgi:LmbE family N-acetylglucosaminyl deacetylase
MTIAAHPGDAIFTMGAPVGVEVHYGGHGVFVCLSLGERGNPCVPIESYGREQEKALLRAAKMLGAEAVVLPFPDGGVPDDAHTARSLRDLIGQFKPRTIISHWGGSCHGDHIACFRLTMEALDLVQEGDRKYAPAAHSAEKLYFAENWEDSKGFETDTYLDITPVYRKWVEACAGFPMWRGETGFRYRDYYRSLASLRGCLSGVPYAAGLMSYLNHGVSCVKSLIDGRMLHRVGDGANERHSRKELYGNRKISLSILKYDGNKK